MSNPAATLYQKGKRNIAYQYIITHCIDLANIKCDNGQFLFNVLEYKHCSSCRGIKFTGAGSRKWDSFCPPVINSDGSRLALFVALNKWLN